MDGDASGERGDLKDLLAKLGGRLGFNHEEVYLELVGSGLESFAMIAERPYKAKKIIESTIDDSRKAGFITECLLHPGLVEQLLTVGRVEEEPERFGVVEKIEEEQGERVVEEVRGWMKHLDRRLDKLEDRLRHQEESINRLSKELSRKTVGEEVPPPQEGLLTPAPPQTAGLPGREPSEEGEPLRTGMVATQMSVKHVVASVVVATLCLGFAMYIFLEMVTHPVAGFSYTKLLLMLFCGLLVSLGVQSLLLGNLPREEEVLEGEVFPEEEFGVETGYAGETEVIGVR